MNKLKYQPLWFRISLAIFASLFILFYGRPLDIIGSFGMPEFYPVLILSTVISSLMIETVHYVTLLLDKRDPWIDQWPERAVLQLCLGILVPLGFDLFVFSVYFQFLDQDITKNGFFFTDFPIIVCFILLLNCYYILHFFIWYAHSNGNEANRVIEKGSDSENVGRESIMNVQYNSTTVNLDVIKDVQYFYRDNKTVKVKTVNGNIYALPYSIAHLNDTYESFGFCQINRGMVINLRIIKGYQIGQKRDTLDLIIKPVYANLVDDLSESFVVTKDNIEKFKSHFDNI